MGHGHYSMSSRNLRASISYDSSKSQDQIFKQNVEKKVNALMSPYGLKLRECRDSADHPNSIPIIIALDVTGSMGVIPEQLIRDGLPRLMGTILKAGINDASVMFLAVGDHKSDAGPIQVGQFEANDELMDKWLESAWLEGNGGGNGGESYFLAWYVAAKHTVTDAWEKRKQKGILITIGDEFCHRNISAEALKNLFGPGEYSDMTAKEILALTQEKWNVFHISLSKHTESEWTERLGTNCITDVTNYSEIPGTIAKIILSVTGISNPKVSDPGDEQPEEEKAGVNLDNIPDIL